MKSSRNKTIDFPLSEGEEYLKKCVKVGDFNGEINSVVIGDTFTALKKVKDKSVDLLIVDPPYNLNKNFHGNTFNSMDNREYEKYTQNWIDSVKSKLKDTASIYVCCDWKSSVVIGNVLSKNFILRNRITWQREKGRGAKENWKNAMEDIFFCTVGEDYTFNLSSVKVRKKVLCPYVLDGENRDWVQTPNGKYRDTCPSNFWDDIAVPYWSMPENTAHPTQKPEKLFAKLILASSDTGNTVLDIFGGSCTTAVVAKKLERNYIVIEQNALYCAWGAKRIADADKNKKIQGYEGGVFWERNSSPDINKERGN